MSIEVAACWIMDCWLKVWRLSAKSASRIRNVHQTRSAATLDWLRIEATQDDFGWHRTERWASTLEIIASIKAIAAFAEEAALKIIAVLVAALVTSPGVPFTADKMSLKVNAATSKEISSPLLAPT